MAYRWRTGAESQVERRTMKFKLKPGMLVKNHGNGALCIVLSVGKNDSNLSYQTQMYVLQSDLLVDKNKKIYWINSVMADQLFEIVNEC